MIFFTNLNSYLAKAMRFHFTIAICGVIAIALYLDTQDRVLPATLFFYAKNLPIEQAEKFERVIVEPENTSKEDIEILKKKGIKVYAYLSIGEVGKYRSWASVIDKNWVLGENSNWRTMVMDMSQPGWHDFLLDKQVKKLWQAGYQGLFIDTMDSYQLFRNKPDEILAQQQGIIQLIKAINKRFPGVNFLLNRGFDVLDEVADLVDGVVAESLFVGWDPKTSTYKSISAEDHYWLLEKLNDVRDKHQLPVTVIDYLPVEQIVQGDRAKEIARKIVSLGFVPWVSTMELNQMGIGLNN